MAWWREQQKVDRALKTKFDFRANKIVSRIEKRLIYYHQVLLSTQALFSASKNVTHHEFGTYVTSLQLQKLYPGIQDIGWARIIPKTQVPTHLENMRRFYPNYRIWPQGDRPLYTAIVQVERRNKLNRHAIGYDMYVDPLRRTAMNQARDKNKLSVTPKTHLLIGPASGENSGFIAYLPIYAYGKPVTSISERRGNIAGWVYAPFHMRELLAALDFVQTDNLAIDIYDGHDTTENALMYRSNHETSSSLIQAKRLESIHRVSFADRQWILHIRSLASFESTIDKTLPYYVAFFGVLSSFLLASLTWSLATGKTHALSLARKMALQYRESESRFRLMADAAPVLIWISDQTFQHIWVNKGWAVLTGDTKSDDHGPIWKSFIHPDDLANLETVIAQSVQVRKAYVAEYRVRRHDGEYRWILTHAALRFDEDGTYMGYVGSSVDVTDRKRAEEKVKLAALVFEHSIDAMTVSEYDKDGTLRIIAVNRAHQEISGYLSSDVIGQNLDLIKSNKHDAFYYAQITQSLAETGCWQGEYWARRKDGTYFLAWINLNVVPDGNSGRRRLITLSRDISRQKESEDMIHALSMSLISAREDEARRIAREIHDDLGQGLFWIRINLKLLPQLLQAQADHLDNSIDSLTASVDACLDTIKRIATRLRPPMLDFGIDLAVSALVEEFKRNTGINCLLINQLASNITLDDDTATNLYRILQESLTNVARHANAKNLHVTLVSEQTHLFLEIRDDGQGFDHPTRFRPGSHGLTGIRERVSLLGGKIDIITKLNQGVTVRVSIPHANKLLGKPKES